MSHEDRERKFEQALQRHLRRDAAGARNEADARAAVPVEARGAAECLDAATLAAFHEDTLSSSEMLVVKEHVANCSRCQEILMQMEAMNEIPLPDDSGKDLKMRESVLSTGALYVDYVAIQTPNLTVAGQPTPASKAPHDISRGSGFKALRWAAPAGAIAAGLLIWIMVRDNKVQTLSHFENVQVAQEQPRNERMAESQPLPASPATKPVTKARRLDEKRKDDSGVKQPAKESGALRAPKSSSSAAITNDVGVVASEARHDANTRQLPIEPRIESSDYASRAAVAGKPPEILSRLADVSATAAAPAPAPPSGNPRVQSAAPVNEAAKADAKESAPATRTFEPHSNGNGGIELLQTQQMVVDDKLEPPAALKKVGLENPKIILAANTTVRWRVLSAGRIEQSVDSGVTWVPQNSGVKAELLAGSAPSEAVCWIVGRSGTILRTTDGGGHWNKVVSPIRGDIAGVQAADAMTAEIFDANKSSRFVTHDGGATWQAAKQ
jgi:Photosynthesis system II assembly factor YCF48